MTPNEYQRKAMRTATPKCYNTANAALGLTGEAGEVADAYGFGPERMKKFFIALQENNDEITRMEKEVDADYAYEKLRLKAERVTGMKIEYLYEHEAKENEA